MCGAMTASVAPLVRPNPEVCIFLFVSGRLSESIQAIATGMSFPIGGHSSAIAYRLAVFPCLLLPWKALLIISVWSQTLFWIRHEGRLTDTISNEVVQLVGNGTI